MSYDRYILKILFKTYVIGLRLSVVVADVVRIYCADHTYVSLKLRLDASVEKIIEMASNKISLGEDLVLCEVKSNGGTS